MYRKTFHMLPRRSFLCRMFHFFVAPPLLLLFAVASVRAQTPYYDSTREGFIVFHAVKTNAQQELLPWYSDDPATAYDQAIRAVWNFWDTMRADVNGLPYYMNHQVWRPANDPRGAGGDQYAMALSSWQLFYQYSGNEKVKENMKFIADYYLTHSLSPDSAAWPHLPYPYNTMIYSGRYDGDMVIGAGYTQPDKAGSFAWELIKLYRMTGNENYLRHAVAIANTLAAKTTAGDHDHSPLPFKVHAITGEPGQLKSNSGDGSTAGLSSYTTNWAGTLELFMALQQMHRGNESAYATAFRTIVDWMKKFPLQNNRWGPFFEDIPGWSDTQINAVTFASFMMNHPDLFPDWRKQVRSILDWVYLKLGNDQWKKYGVKAVNEQTAYQTPGNSHTSRQAAAELTYAMLTGDTTQKHRAILQLNWATYCVNRDGKNCYPRDEVWMTDGYGDFVRHYLRAMAACPELAPAEPHILSSSSIVMQADYPKNLNKRLEADFSGNEIDSVLVHYKTSDRQSVETIRLPVKPSRVTVNKIPIKENAADGWQWKSLATGGVLTVRHSTGNAVTVFR